jgi:hypothetical protein
MGKAHGWEDKGGIPKNEDELNYHLILGLFFWESPPHIQALAKKNFKMYLESTWNFPLSKGKVIWKVNCPLKLFDF